MIYTRISSGLDFLDAAYGGLYSNRSFIVRGPAQSGRTSVALQFLLAGLENGENGIMISSDRIENVILKAETMGLTLEPYLMDNRLILMEYPKEILSGHFQLGGVIHLLGEIERYVKTYHCTRLVFDTLIPLLAKAREPHVTNYVYSLMSSLDALHVSTVVTTGEPNSPLANRITELIEDAAVGSFSLSNVPAKTGLQRMFTVHKMVNPINPPVSYKVRFEYGVGVVLDTPGTPGAKPTADLQPVGPQLTDVPLQIAILDSDDETTAQLEDFFSPGSHIISLDTAEELAAQHLHMDYDLILLNANHPGYQWRSVIERIREIEPKQAVFILTDPRNTKLTYQNVKQSGGDGLFTKPLIKSDLIRALEKTLRSNGTFDEIIEKRSSKPAPMDLPEDFTEDSSSLAETDASKGSDNLISLTVFKDMLHMQIWRCNQNQGRFALVSFRMINTIEITRLPNLPQGLELVKRIASIIGSSLRGLNDTATRSMDKVVVLLEDCDRDGAEAFTRRVFGEVKAEISARLNIQLGKHLLISNAIAVFPQDGDNVQDLLGFVTESARNFKLIS
ncbi:MAG: hypothetical protein OEM52_06415 [bacterium]|nr:hypothetical protein [bacterium]